MINVFKYIRYDNVIGFYLLLPVILAFIALIPLEFDPLQKMWLFLLWSVLMTRASPLMLSQFISIRKSDVLNPEIMARKLAHLILIQSFVHLIEAVFVFLVYEYILDHEHAIFWAVVFFSIASGTSALVLLLKRLGPVFSRPVEILFLLGMLMPQFFLILVPYESILAGQFDGVMLLPLLGSLIFYLMIGFLSLFAVSQWWAP